MGRPDAAHRQSAIAIRTGELRRSVVVRTPAKSVWGNLPGNGSEWSRFFAGHLHPAELFAGLYAAETQDLSLHPSGRRSRGNAYAHWLGWGLRSDRSSGMASFRRPVLVAVPSF